MAGKAATTSAKDEYLHKQKVQRCFKGLQRFMQSKRKNKVPKIKENEMIKV